MSSFYIPSSVLKNMKENPDQVWISADARHLVTSDQSADPGYFVVSGYDFRFLSTEEVNEIIQNEITSLYLGL